MLRLLLAMTLGAVAGEASAGCNKDLLNVEGWSAKSMAERRVVVSMDLRSTAPKPIRIIEALVYFRDALDGDIGALPVERDAHIPAGGSYTRLMKSAPANFDRLLKLRKQDVETHVCVFAVLYEDGTEETF
ncbi:hypothetical protein GHK50_22505 [Sinorhizobium medicae]|uniref:Uncharacterized protein n=1 Tax=Sinorhizobium medicae TaxID=110321 RepID=A0A6G1WW07_9HYPH|nr:hypothetical protein [Sinorhizobium medicae]MDX0849181.1 hypothetical protein [Sinorhizobium medicae]MQW73861.1 hypothetical protein [Sinorhizobium medicae]MQX85787.1 hypothetical protein [Sinorhizobium medicae]